MKKPVAAVILATLGMVAGNAMAEQSPWLVRVRVERLSPADKADPVGGAGASDRISVSKKTIPELDISYFFSPNVSAELILTYPQKHDVYLDGGKIGTFKHLPPTLLGQYHFTPEATFSPYVGAGLNYTNITKVDLLNGAGGLEHKSFGLALQAGADYKIDKNWSLNFDVKKIQIRSDVTISGAKVSNVQVDPWLVGVGVGYRF
ncbi:MAG: OmpW family outer membrane protein [Pseudomonas sp.]